MSVKENLLKYWKESRLIKDKRLFKAFKAVDRKNFILPEYESEAYGDYPLPLPGGQTISQPSTVMIMIEALELKETDKVLEIGAGSGWCAALIAYVAKKGKIATTEIIKELADFAKNNIKKMKIKNVQVIHADGSKGYKQKAPYNKIIVTSACPAIPQPLIDQLKEGGIILAPIGNLYSQTMIKAKKVKGKLQKEFLGEFRFVPLKGKYGF